MTRPRHNITTRVSSSTWRVGLRSVLRRAEVTYSLGMYDHVAIPHPLTPGTRHCAEAVLSFSNEVTLVGSIGAPLLDFAAAWAESNSDYDFIIARTFPPSWCSLHRPVISLRSPASHWVYSGIDPLEPDGLPVRCHRGCGLHNLDPCQTSRKVKITCRSCHSTCEVGVTEVSSRTALGRREILKVAFPPPDAETNWTPPNQPQGKPPVQKLLKEGVGAKEEVRGRPTKGSQSRGRRGRGGPTMDRSQAHSVPRLPSEAMAPPMAPPMGPMRTMSQAPTQGQYPQVMAHNHHQLQRMAPAQPLPLHWLPGANPLALHPNVRPPSTHPLPPPPHTAGPTHWQAKRQKFRHNSPP
jgi:hypothetical protein